MNIHHLNQYYFCSQFSFKCTRCIDLIRYIVMDVQTFQTFCLFVLIRATDWVLTERVMFFNKSLSIYCSEWCMIYWLICRISHVNVSTRTVLHFYLIDYLFYWMFWIFVPRLKDITLRPFTLLFSFCDTFAFRKMFLKFDETTTMAQFSYEMDGFGFERVVGFIEQWKILFDNF